ncbi:cell envelope-related function transcriptional attenuator common domain-containing protein [Paenibacillus catalpae]|uniref:Cell envelope-related function transcriptional attenuator common domain-containing protein n=1 Tax=Paenibacillus catalpae TaxID=1045775 RepID=A0A1I1Y380_9BACL|nr:LCP family protein [Paenibacillus catalpae]SFE12250.1 cell envelope-related function transcriptional attenuator common domain-containing protein [Paenibacillus catalpae]
MKRGWKRALIGIGAGFVIIAAGTAGYVWHLYGSVKETADKIYEPIQPTVYVSKDPEVTVKPQQAVQALIEKRHPFTVMVMGVDERENDKGRSDTLIVLAVNPEKKSILMFNIPRDTRTEIIGHGTTDKINHAYAFGGVTMAKNTVEHFLDYPIDYYIRINMEGFEHLIDILGGVEVNNPFTFYYGEHQFNQGKIKLNGELALLYSRMRYEDPRGDQGRNARQREILVEVMKSSLQFSNITQVQKILKELGTSVKTNITFEEMKTFMTDYREDLGNIDTVEISGSGSTINQVWYLIVSREERERIHDLLKEQMDIDQTAS